MHACLACSILSLPGSLEHMLHCVSRHGHIDDILVCLEPTSHSILMSSEMNLTSPATTWFPQPNKFLGKAQVLSAMVLQAQSPSPFTSKFTQHSHTCQHVYKLQRCCALICTHRVLDAECVLASRSTLCRRGCTEQDERLHHRHHCGTMPPEEEGH